MSYSLPPVSAGKRIDFKHFPNRICCFVFRNWEIIEPSALAAVVGAEEGDILALAGKMGLPVPPDVNADWRRLGYITVIRANWHLLNYRQICALLGWSEEKLAFTLKEDDFLDVKLGHAKPDVPDLIWKELTETEEGALTAVRDATLEFYSSVPPVTAGPFAFRDMFAAVADSGDNTGETRFESRIAYSYCALYGDTFMGDTSDSFPDELLAAYKAVGVNGIWCQAVLYTLVLFPFDPSVSEGFEERLAGLRALIKRMSGYGIKLYLYLNEPRTMPNSFFEKHPQLKGVTGGEYSSLCTSAPEIQAYLYDSAAYLVKNAPGLGGFFTITASENQTSCYSHRSEHNCECPRCKNRSKAEVIAEINTLLYKGAASVDPDIKMIAWSWGWEGENTPRIIDLMPEEVIVMGVSEQAVEKNIGGTVIGVIDYSISVVGPGEYAVSTWNHAHEKGHRAYAKCQFNNTWECSFVPFLPAYEQIYRHMTGLIAQGVDGMLLDWTLGGFPSPTFSMINPLFYKSDTIPSLRELYSRVFPSDAVDTVEKACHLFSEAFDAFPFHIGTAYTAPQNTGTANLLYREPTGFHATMVGFPYDDITSWRAVFPEEVFENQLRLLSEGWERGLEILQGLNESDLKKSAALTLLADCAEAAYCHFRSSYLQTRFVRVRDGRAEGSLTDIAKQEAALTLRLAAVEARNPAIGYESSNHYFYYRAALAEKYINCLSIKN
ncbi:MAG: hypothetical protein ACYCWE_05200 [Eubacteriales bacterium]